MAKYRKRPIIIEAVQWTGTNENYRQMLDFAGLRIGPWGGYEGSPYILTIHEEQKLLIKTLEGPLFASLGDWVIRGIQGEFYPCKPDIFKASYELVEEIPTTLE